MSNINLTVFGGRICRDITFRDIANGSKFAGFSVVNNEKFGDKEFATFLSCKAWGNTAEFINKYFSKGSKIEVRGFLREETWEKDGVSRKSLVLNVERAYFVDSKAPGGEETPAPGRADKPGPGPKRPVKPAPTPPVEDDEELDDSEVPF